MTLIAQVIVDVPSRGTDRPFDYIVPESMRGWLEVGSRVGVPFGPRTLQGFVIGLSGTSETPANKLKSLQELLDLVPPLSEELVELSEWMSAKYACHRITALQSMLPAALKGKAERYIRVAERESWVGEDSLFDATESLLTDEEEQIVSHIQKQQEVRMELLSRRFGEQAHIIKSLLQRGILLESRSIRDKVQKKTVRTVSLHLPEDEIRTIIEEFPAKAKRQQEVLTYIADTGGDVPLKEIMTVLGVTASTVKALADKGYIAIMDMEVYRDPYQDRNFTPSTPFTLTDEQQQVYNSIISRINKREQGEYLIHGITGSGKTEVYLQCIQRVIEQDRQAIMLVPEIALTPQMVERFKGRFGDRVAVMHSRLSSGERYDEWRKIREGKSQVAIGARSAIFAPFSNLGLIIMDEEHETSYKQEESPKYHARDVAIHRAHQHNAVVILGSATPSLESYYAARSQANDEFMPTLLEIHGRALGSELPAVEIIDMREELKEGNRSMFSRPLHQAIEDRLEKKQQIVLLLNRRGHSTFVMCRTCGYVAECPNCDISLTYHQRSNSLRCHYCGHAEPAPQICPECGSEHIRYFGTGTQRVEEELAKLFPGIRVVRMDVDTTTQKGSHEKLLNQFRDKKADLLLGTQMVAKGLDFPDVTLVGVIAADSALHLPDFRAAEKTFQLLTQVAGRAGRHHLPGEVIVQTYNPEHYSVIHASRHDYGSFVREELKHRQTLGYPPYCRLALITFSHEKLALLVRIAENYTQMIKDQASKLGWLGSLERFSNEALDVLGPVASPIPRLKNRYRFQCMIKWRGDMDVAKLAEHVAEQLQDSVRDKELLISIDVDPQVLM
ncbi:primosomal protein N' (replication factor Y) [Paenibacillus sp. SORGH_AS306]|uniref:primosomal protein N' n=1 Tax=unclassified Paenibacillus TaxID=185978 RepID=UPI0027801536|nr:MULTISPECIES: primosomal protein N' [unclassified Paenibacillus]MDQ1234913.1 primosomal protein N' (replication factor Y) [Paenibacillus sp. SORGH_AS_0306]MDR6111961.1 primosomal protein N' (replication factor Y) [Paenibacillus sp. SORGH_AS_0338]